MEIAGKKKILNDNPNEILYISFNQDGSNIAVGTQNGFKIMNTYPFLDLYYKDLGGGIGMIEMLNKTNILTLVGGGKNPKYPINELIIWDEDKNKEIAKIKTKKKILNVKISEKHIYIVNIEKILVFDFNTLNLVESFNTKNPKGLITLCYKEEIVAFPDIQHPGTLKIKNYNSNKDYTLKAHKSPLNCIQLNQDGKLIGTCSLKGTLIRVYNIENGQLIREVRRGAESANVNCIFFDISQKYFVVASDRKTIHIFFLINIISNENQISNNPNSGNNSNDNIEGDDLINNISNSDKNIIDINNKKSIFEGMSNFFKVGKRYFGSEWSFSKIKLNGAKSLVIFGPDNSIIIVTYEGKYYQASFDFNGEDCYKIKEEKF